ncbi:hypothetical protein [Microtetraspora niveoalba]|uniref:hypothetical protein n=1 Tax=Microtetraspora niveoalba TaxID=46175 RepID=UPI0008308F45|nr:hypothetical protein [Microtetraspora niveoalba]
MSSVPAEISAQRRIAVDISWARTPNRSERTEAARRASPMRIEYWEKKIRETGIVREEDIPKAAASAYRAHMRAMSLKAAKARQARKEARLARARNSPS